MPTLHTFGPFCFFFTWAVWMWGRSRTTVIFRDGATAQGPGFSLGPLNVFRPE